MSLALVLFTVLALVAVEAAQPQDDERTLSDWESGLAKELSDMSIQRAQAAYVKAKDDIVSATKSKVDKARKSYEARYAVAWKTLNDAVNPPPEELRAMRTASKIINQVMGTVSDGGQAERGSLAAIWANDAMLFNGKLRDAQRVLLDTRTKISAGDQDVMRETELARKRIDTMNAKAIVKKGQAKKAAVELGTLKMMDAQRDASTRMKEEHTSAMKANSLVGNSFAAKADAESYARKALEQIGGAKQVFDQDFADIRADNQLKRSGATDQERIATDHKQQADRSKAAFKGAKEGLGLVLAKVDISKGELETQKAELGRVTTQEKEETARDVAEMERMTTEEKNAGEASKIAEEEKSKTDAKVDTEKSRVEKATQKKNQLEESIKQEGSSFDATKSKLDLDIGQEKLSIEDIRSQIASVKEDQGKQQEIKVAASRAEQTSRRVEDEALRREKKQTDLAKDARSSTKELMAGSAKLIGETAKAEVTVNAALSTTVSNKARVAQLTAKKMQLQKQLEDVVASRAQTMLEAKKAEFIAQQAAGKKALSGATNLIQTDSGVEDTYNPVASIAHRLNSVKLF